MTKQKSRVYVASSWRNAVQSEVVSTLRSHGHEVYDFKNPAPDNTGFAWSEIDRDWLNWTPERFAPLLATHPVAAAGFKLDKDALDWCDTCVLVLPCGRSAHLEAGYAAGQGKRVYFLLHPDKFEPELMYLLGTACSTSIDEIMGWMALPRPADEPAAPPAETISLDTASADPLACLHPVVMGDDGTGKKWCYTCGKTL